MATKSPKKKKVECEDLPCEVHEEVKDVDGLEKVVINNVLGLLGKPSYLTKSRATKIKDGRYRVNFWGELPNDDENCEALTTKYRITDSFFVWVDKVGNILRSNPEIRQKY